MLPTVAVQTDDDEARWAEAETLLDGSPAESAQRHLRQWQWRQGLLIASVVLVTVAVLVLLLIEFHGSLGQHHAHTSPWRAVGALVLMGTGLVVMIVGFVAFNRSNRGVETWRNPLMVLTRGQRTALLDQVRGRSPLDPARIRLARLLARQHDVQRKALLTNVGLCILFFGNWILEPTADRAVLIVFLLVLLMVVVPLRLVRARGVGRFLAEHPAEG